MAGKNNGTGQPFYFRCSNCRKHGKSDEGTRSRVIRTGLTKPRRVKTAGRMLDTSHQYVCMDCGHVGYSAHFDIVNAIPVVVADVFTGEERAWVECRTCKRAYTYGYLPNSLSRRILTLPCGHDTGQHFADSVTRITEQEARIRMAKQLFEQTKGKDAEAHTTAGR